MLLLLVLLVLALEHQCQAGNSAIDWNLYHTTEAILEYSQKLASSYPSIASFEEIPDPQSQFRLPVLTLTDTSNKSPKPLILLVGGEHSRELITSEILYWLSALFAGDQQYQTASQWPAVKDVEHTAVGKGWADSDLQSWARVLLQQVALKIIPVLNIAGRREAESGNLCLRKTISGVDLNRNWPYAWQKNDASLDDFGGPQAFSEPEARVIKLLAQAHSPHSYVNLHSGEWAMYLPWDSKAETAPDLPGDSGALLEAMNEYCQCMNGPAGKVAGYLAMGTSMDWMYAEHHVPYPLTFEVYGPKDLGKLSAGGHPRHLLQGMGANVNVSSLGNVTVEQTIAQSLDEKDVASNQASTGSDIQQNGTSSIDCFPMFNPPTRAEYEAVVASWLGSLLVLAQHIVSQPVQSLASFHAEQLQQPELIEGSNKVDILSSSRKQEQMEALPKLHEEVFPISEKGVQSGLGIGMGRKAQDGLKQAQQYQHLAEPAKTLQRRQEIMGYDFVNRFSWILSSLFIIAGIGLIVHARYKRTQTRGKQSL